VCVGARWPVKIAAGVDGPCAKADDYFDEIFLFRFFIDRKK
jgi:hypothetical protein